MRPSCGKQGRPADPTNRAIAEPVIDRRRLVKSLNGGDRPFTPSADTPVAADSRSFATDFAAAMFLWVLQVKPEVKYGQSQNASRMVMNAKAPMIQPASMRCSRSR